MAVKPALCISERLELQARKTHADVKTISELQISDESYQILCSNLTDTTFNKDYCFQI